MFKGVKPDNVDDYIAAVPPGRKEIIEALHTFIQEQAPGLKPFFAHNMLGYGKFKYTNYKKEVVDWPIVALANQKSYVSLYVCSVDSSGKYLAEKYAKQLGKVNTGKSCIRFKKLEDLNMDALVDLLQQAAGNPGL